MKTSYYFVTISDAHIGWGLSSGFGEDVVPTLEKLDPKPLFIVNLGDMGHRNDREKNSDLYKEMVSKIAKSEETLYHVCGNHDVGNEPKIENYEWYKRKFNSDIFYSFEKNNTGFLVLETNMMCNPNEETKKLMGEQLKWLENELEKLSSRNDLVIPFMHTPLLLTYWKEEPCHFIVPSEISKEIRQMFQKSGKVSKVFSGHYHMLDKVVESGIEYHTVSSCAAPLTQSPNDPRKKFEKGIGIVKIRIFLDDEEEENNNNNNNNNKELRNVKMDYKYFSTSELQKMISTGEFSDYITMKKKNSN